MDQNTLVTIVIFVINLIIAGIVGFVTASFKIGQYQNKVDNLETTVGKDEHGGLRKTVGDVRDKVIACETALKEREPLTRKRSPVTLTDRGAKFLQDSGSKQFVEDNFDELLKKIEDLKPTTAYDVQENAKRIVEELRGDERLNPIKEFLFKDGSSMDDVVTVMGTYLRDKILKHKNWNIEDIDSHLETDKKDEDINTKEVSGNH